MKKLMWTLLSLMLFLGWGTAFAQPLPTPTFTPASGAAVPPGQVITVDVPSQYLDADEYLSVVVLYVENDDATVLEAKDLAALTSAAMQDMGMGGQTDPDPDRVWKTASYDLDMSMWMSNVRVSENATGTVKLRMRLVTATYSSELAYSDEFTATYTIDAGAVVRPTAPTITLGADGKLSMTNGYDAEDMMHNIMYKVNGTDADFEGITTMDELMSKERGLDIYEEPISYTAGQTVKAVTAEVIMGGSNQTIILSEIVTYPESAPVVKPAAPVFSPDGGEVVKGSKITLTNGYESDATPLKIYYNYGTKKATDITNIKTLDDLKAAGRNGLTSMNAANEYKTPFTISTPSTYNAATANIDADGNITWSDVTTASFTIKVVEPAKPAAPEFSPDGGEVANGSAITLNTTCEDCEIYYSINGSDDDFFPETADDFALAKLVYYEKAITLTADATIKAAAAQYNDEGEITWSDIVTKTFTVTGEAPETVAIPTITPANDARVHMGDMVTIECETEGAEIYYTTDGTAPFNGDGDGYPVSVKEGALKYTEPFALTEGMLIKQGDVYALKIRAVATKDGKISPNGGSAGYAVNPNIPVFTPEAGEVALGEQVTISCVPSVAKIYYTTDGTTPTMEESAEYTAPIEITGDMTIRAIAVLGQYQAAARAEYKIGLSGELVLDPAKYIEPGSELQCEITGDILDAYTDIFVLYTDNNSNVVLESDAATLINSIINGDPANYKVAVMKDKEWVKPMVMSENAPAEVKFRARIAVLKEDDVLLYGKEEKTTYYTIVPAPVINTPGLLGELAGQEIDCTVPVGFDWEQANGMACVVYVEDNDNFKLEELTAGEIASVLNPTDQGNVDENLPYGVAVCVPDEDNEGEYMWPLPVVLSEEADGITYIRARLVMFTQKGDEPEVTFSSEVEKYFYTELPAARFADDGEVIQGDALNVELPAEVDFAEYLDQAFILYVENDAQTELKYDGTMGELQALAQGGSSVAPLEEGGLKTLSAKTADLPYKVAVYDAEWQEWNPAVFLTTMGQADVRARLAVSKNWDGALDYSDEFTAVYTVKERPLPDAPKFVVGGTEVAGETVAVAEGAEVSLKSGYEDNDDYFVCYVVNGTDEDFENASMTEIAMGTSSVKMYEPDLTKLVINEAQTIKAATAQLLASGDIWWSEITTVAFKMMVAKPAFSVKAGAVRRGTEVRVTCETEGAVVYYTIDGTEPSEKSTENGAIVINEAMTIKAIAIKDGVKSEVATAAYTIDDAANEDEELMGVSVYPNPSNGLFNIELPVAASIEVFMSNGMLYQRLALKEGHNTLTIERSGIYFFRITGEGRTVIKRVIVR